MGRPPVPERLHFGIHRVTDAAESALSGTATDAGTCGVGGAQGRHSQILLQRVGEAGPGKDVLIGDLRRFRDTVRDSGLWSKEDVAALETATQTADGVRLIHKVLHSTNLQSAGKFSPRAPAKGESANATLEEKITAYEAAFALRRRDPTAGHAEINRLNKLYGGD
jgi:hypothetical protein